MANKLASQSTKADETNKIGESHHAVENIPDGPGDFDFQNSSQKDESTKSPAIGFLDPDTEKITEGDFTIIRNGNQARVAEKERAGHHHYSPTRESGVKGINCHLGAGAFLPDSGDQDGQSS